MEELKQAEYLIGQIQQKLYHEAPINSFEPFHPPMQAEKEDGSWYVSEIKYDGEFPNSFLDITYPCKDLTLKHPTVVYFHGGGFFGGDKAMGDPLAAGNPANRLFGEIVSRGYTFVNVNYALVPDYHFPVPLIQTVRALDFLKTHTEEYRLDMERVIVFGQSAGAVLAGQYGALLSSKDYRRLLQLQPLLTAKEISALIIDDAPFRTTLFDGNIKIIMGNYYGTMEMNEYLDAQTNAIRYITKEFPPTFLTAGNLDGFPEDMQAFSDQLIKAKVEQEYYFVPKSTEPLPHGYLNLVDTSISARKCFDHLLAFMDHHV